jgi:nucleotide-binding universal stress UspA family protein
MKLEARMPTATQLQTESQREKTVNFRTIVVATDFSPASQRALDFALAIARRYGEEISLVHAIPSELHGSIPMDCPTREIDREQLQAEVEMRCLEQQLDRRDVVHRVVVRHGPVWEVLSSVIKQDKAGLLVLGTRGSRAVKKLALGSVAEEVLRVASCPVLTVSPRTRPAPEEANFQRILFLTDFGPASSKAFRYALFLSEDCRAKLILFHAVPPVAEFQRSPSAYVPAPYAAQDLEEWQGRMQEGALRKLKALVPANSKLSARAEYVTDSSPDAILNAVAKHEPDLIVMGANRARSARLAAHLPWTVAHGVLCEAHCPVLTVGDNASIEFSLSHSTLQS